MLVEFFFPPTNTGHEVGIHSGSNANPVFWIFFLKLEETREPKGNPDGHRKILQMTPLTVTDLRIESDTRCTTGLLTTK